MQPLTSTSLTTTATGNVPPPPPPSAPSPPAPAPAPKVDSFERGAPSAFRASSTSSAPPTTVDPSLAAQLTRGRLVATGGAAPAPLPTPLSSATKLYDKSGDAEHSLDSVESRRALIASSPQLGDAAGGNGETRCGGAAITNALIADGAYKENAAALRKVGEELGVSVENPNNAAFASALDAMEQGKLTPNQAAEIQERVFEMAYGVEGGEGTGGMTQRGIAEISGRLARAGAFPNTCELTFHLDQSSGTSNHYTMSLLDHDGQRTFANSWPDPKAGGKATVSEVDPKTPGVCEAGGIGEVKLEVGAKGALELKLQERTGGPAFVSFQTRIDPTDTTGVLEGKVGMTGVCLP